MAGRSIATALELDIGGDTFGYTLHRVVGRKHVHLVVDEDARLQVRAPWRFSCESAAEVVIENLLWVRGALERATRAAGFRDIAADARREAASRVASRGADGSADTRRQRPSHAKSA